MWGWGISCRHEGIPLAVLDRSLDGHMDESADAAGIQRGDTSKDGCDEVRRFNAACVCVFRLDAVKRLRADRRRPRADESCADVRGDVLSAEDRRHAQRLLRAVRVDFRRARGGRVPGDPNWPGASKNSGKSFNIDGEVSFFLDQCLSAAEQVADAHKLTSNSHVMNPDTGKQQIYGWNPYFEMFYQPDASGIDEVLLYREYSVDLGVTTAMPSYIREGGACGPTRSHVDGFLMANGLPIYAADSGYKGDETLDLQQEGRDERLQLFVFNNGDLEWYSNGEASLFIAPEFLEQPEHRDVTGFRIRKHYSYDPAFSTSGLIATNDQILYRAAEAYLNYIEAYYEKNGNIGGKADTYWKAIRTRAGVDPDYNKTIAATDLSKEDDWGKRSGETLVDATLFNIRRERRCEFIGEGFRWDDLIRWRSFDHLMTEKWIPEGCNLWGGPLKDNEKYLKKDAAGNVTTESAFIECASGKSDANISSRTDSKYVRPLRVIMDNNELYDGYTWHKAYYLQPYGLQDLTLTSEDGSVEKSVAYQNPFWPTQASEGALE